MNVFKGNKTSARNRRLYCGTISFVLQNDDKILQNDIIQLFQIPICEKEICAALVNKKSLKTNAENLDKTHFPRVYLPSYNLLYDVVHKMDANAT